METTKKITHQELINRLRERAEKAHAEGKTTVLPTKHREIVNRLRERAEKLKAEGKTINAMPAQRSEFLAKLRERAMLNTGLKKTEATEKVTEIEKKEE